MNAMENYMVEDFSKYAPEDERENKRDRVRAELIRYNEDSIGLSDQYRGPTSPADYIEPTSDGYPGLEPPIG